MPLGFLGGGGLSGTCSHDEPSWLKELGQPLEVPNKSSVQCDVLEHDFTSD